MSDLSYCKARASCTVECFGSGGGINSNVYDTTVTMATSTVSGNTATAGPACTLNCGGDGGGVLDGGVDLTTSVTTSTVAGNTASAGPACSDQCNVDDGGLLFEGISVTATLTTSTVSGNTAVVGSACSTQCDADGAGFGNDGIGVTATVTNSTVAGNTAGAGSACTTSCFLAGGGMWNEGIYVGLTVSDSSLIGNGLTTSSLCTDSCEASGGGIDTFGISISTQFEATILADNGSSGDCSGGDSDQGYNIDDDGSCGFSGSSTSDSPTLDATLGPLANNGGATKTVALLTGSPAIDVVPIADCPPTDQRGAPRTGSACDIGAYDTDAYVCPSGTPHYLTATYGSATFFGLFCVNANGDGSYTQFAPGFPVTQTLTGTGHIRVNQGVTSIQASGSTSKSFSLVGTTNGTTSSFSETTSGLPNATGTFTVS